MKNSRTTTLGILTIITAVASAITALVDTDPNTIPDWGSVVAAVTAGVGLIFAKDATPKP
jgi:hypothetical protein